MKGIKTRLCEILDLKAPIFQAPMGGATTPELTSAVANYGGLGMIPLPPVSEFLSLLFAPLGLKLGATTMLTQGIIDGKY